MDVTAALLREVVEPSASRNYVVRAAEVHKVLVGRRLPAVFYFKSAVVEDRYHLVPICLTHFVVSVRVSRGHVGRVKLRGRRVSVAYAQCWKMGGR